MSAFCSQLNHTIAGNRIMMDITLKPSAKIGQFLTQKPAPIAQTTSKPHLVGLFYVCLSVDVQVCVCVCVKDAMHPSIAK